MGSLGAAFNGYLHASAFTSSSETIKYGPENGRLNTPNAAWIPRVWQPDLSKKDHANLDYLQIDLQSVKTVSAVSTQGLQSEFFVRRFSLMFSIDGEEFDPFFQANDKQVCFFFNSAV